MADCRPRSKSNERGLIGKVAPHGGRDLLLRRARARHPRDYRTPACPPAGWRHRPARGLLLQRSGSRARRAGFARSAVLRKSKEERGSTGASRWQDAGDENLTEWQLSRRVTEIYSTAMLEPSGPFRS